MYPRQQTRLDTWIHNMVGKARHKRKTRLHTGFDTLHTRMNEIKSNGEGSIGYGFVFRVLSGTSTSITPKRDFLYASQVSMHFFSCLHMHPKRHVHAAFAVWWRTREKAWFLNYDCRFLVHYQHLKTAGQPFSKPFFSLMNFALFTLGSRYNKALDKKESDWKEWDTRLTWYIPTQLQLGEDGAGCSVGAVLPPERWITCFLMKW